MHSYFGECLRSQIPWQIVLGVLCSLSSEHLTQFVPSLIVKNAYWTFSCMRTETTSILLTAARV